MIEGSEPRSCNCVRSLVIYQNVYSQMKRPTLKYADTLIAGALVIDLDHEEDTLSRRLLQTRI